MAHINKGRFFSIRGRHSIQSDGNAVDDDGYSGMFRMLTYHWSYRGNSPDSMDAEVRWQLSMAKSNRQDAIFGPALSGLCAMQSTQRLMVGAGIFDGIASVTEEVIKQQLQHWHDFQAHQHPAKSEDGQLKLLPAAGGSSETHQTNDSKSICALTRDNALSSDFFCKVCFMELPNVHFHCDDCEKTYQHSYNICVDCFVAKDYIRKRFVHLRPENGWDAPKEKDAKEMPVKQCPYCDVQFDCEGGARCECHTFFSIQYRFWREGEMEKRLKVAEEHHVTNPTTHNK